MPEPDPFLRKKQILAELGINSSTLWLWIRKGHFPKPTVLNAGTGSREIIAWPQSVFLQWKANLPVRQAKVITEAAYQKRRKPVRRPE